MNDASVRLGYQPRLLSARDVKVQVSELSSAVLDMVQVKGRVSEGGPMELPWDQGEDPDAFHNVTHLWSLRGVDESALEGGMAALAQRLPENGWHVVRNGPDSSRNRNQEILATHLATHIQLEATFEPNTDLGDPRISFSLYSRFFVSAKEPGQ
ncbi:hypothetical protein [Streptomyces sp. NBC_01198]|uniref:hypothetical protein n=1 Tax=Streptomyces sp. NBC_01198 TaxID=2903769 RepID=UPI002E14EA2D|nr:hypothetical protein OG702_06790 [Streptomyces sp. NBC_01198]